VRNFLSALFSGSSSDIGDLLIRLSSNESSAQAHYGFLGREKGAEGEAG
jgi:hypothetical protein